MKTKSFTYTQEKKLEDISQFSDVNLYGLSSLNLNDSQVNIIIQLLNRADTLNNNIDDYDEELFQIEIDNIAKQIKMVSENDTEYCTLVVTDLVANELTIFSIPDTFESEQIELFITEQSIDIDNCNYGVVESIRDLRYKI